MLIEAGERGAPKTATFRILGATRGNQVSSKFSINFNFVLTLFMTPLNGSSPFLVSDPLYPSEDNPFPLHLRPFSVSFEISVNANCVSKSIHEQLSSQAATPEHISSRAAKIWTHLQSIAPTDQFLE